MGGLFGGKPDTSAQVAMQQKQLELQQKQQDKLDAQERDAKASVLARQRATASGGSRSLMSTASLSGDSGGQQTLGTNT